MMTNNTNPISSAWNDALHQPKATSQAKPLKAKLPKPLRLAKALSVLMDSAIRIPFINKNIGLDGILGTFPIAGDIVTFTVALYGVGLAVYYKVPNTLVARMIGNIAIDLLIGVVPVLGDVFDVFFKANLRNYTLLIEHLENEMPHILYPDVIPTPKHTHSYEEATPASHAVVDVTPAERS
jgi:hypothetical protein